MGPLVHKDLLVLQALLEQPVILGLKGHKALQDLLVLMGPLVHKDLLVPPDLKALLVLLEPQVSQEPQEIQVQQEQPDQAGTLQI
jgi:hypothetical protein